MPAVAVAVAIAGTEQPGGRQPASNTPSQKIKMGVLPKCPHVDVPMITWSEVITRDPRLRLRLPTERDSMPPRDGETWIFPGGSIGYRFSQADERWYDSLLADSTAKERGWCEEEIAGVPTLIQYTYASTATGAGYYLQAIWRVGPQEEVRLVGLMRDTTRAGLLLEIARRARVVTPGSTP